MVRQVLKDHNGEADVQAKLGRLEKAVESLEKGNQGAGYAARSISDAIEFKERILREAATDPESTLKALQQRFFLYESPALRDLISQIRDSNSR